MQRSHSYNSFLRLANNQLPPFYNKPPALIPSHSLTSLIRRRNNNSNHHHVGAGHSSGHINDTPEVTSSDEEFVASVLGGISRSSNSYEYYGFVLYLGSTVLFLFYLAWGLLGNSVIERHLPDLGFPDRWWALAIPAWLVVSLAYIYVALACFNTNQLTPALSDRRTLTDGYANVCHDPNKFTQGTDAVLDLPIGVVCNALYHGSI